MNSTVRVLTRYEERLRLVTHRLRGFLVEAGVGEEQQAAVLEVYRVHKQLFSSVPVDLTYEAEGMRLGPLTFTHVPGHCPGQVVMQIDDVLLSGDHVLSVISPHQSPEVLSDYTGLGHYLESLERIRPFGGQRALDTRRSPATRCATWRRAWTPSGWCTSTA